MEQNVPVLLPFAALCAFYVAAAGLMVAAALHDLAFRTVPNWLPVAVFSIGVVAASLNHHLIYSLASAVGLFIVAALCWRRGLMGGGDVKLLAASAALLPPGRCGEFVLLVSLCGGLLAIIYLVLQRLIRTPSTARPWSLLGRILKAERWRVARRGPLPYASAIAAGALLTVFGG